MDMIRKRPAPSHERCDTTPETTPVAQPDPPAQPLDLLFPLDACPSRTGAKPAADGESDALPTYPPLFRRIRPRPRHLAAPSSVGSPDWKLSTGATIVLLGLAIAFGTYITLTQRDAMQSRLRRIVDQNELRAMPRHERPTIAERTQELARTLREQIETLRSRDATDAAVMAGATVQQPANAHSSTLASSTPGLPATSTVPVPPRASPARTPAKQLAAKPLAPPLPQPAPHTHPLASVTPARAHGTTIAQQEHKTSTKPASTACGTRSPCMQASEQSQRKPVVKVAARPAPTKASASGTARHAPVKVAARPAKPTKPAPRITPPTVQAWTPPDVTPALPVSDDTLVYRQH